MKEFTVEIRGQSQGDIETALERVLQLIKEGYLAGTDSDDIKGFSFYSTGEYTETKTEDEPDA